ncbi:MAG: DUF5667 domain-containing protein [Chloroflexi bacterium]|nr:DUF5667 domain-containing protein [Chloroflexota bacterium]
MIENPFEPTPGDEEVERQLTAYAAARLDPSRAVAERTRGTVMAAARSRRVPSGGALFGRANRLAAAAMLAAVLLLGVAGATFAASPGGPLYGLRLWVEEVTLPTEANARAEAQLALLQERLAEAHEASASGNANGVAAALAAYRDEVADLLETAGDDDLRLARLEAALGTHLVALRTLSSQVPEQARGAIQRAIDNSANAVEEVHESQGQPATSPGPDGSQGPNRSPGPSRTPPAGPPSGLPSPPGQQP